MINQPLSGVVRQYVDALALLGAEAHQPGAALAARDNLGKLVDIDNFERVTGIDQTRSWAEHIDGLALWLTQAELSCEIVALDEAPNVVFAEMNERNVVDGRASVQHTLAIYDFNDDGRIARLTTYVQKPPPAEEPDVTA